MLQYGQKPGDLISIGGKTLPILGAVTKLPGEASAFASIAPRVLIPRAELSASLLVRGSLVRYFAYLKLPPRVDVSRLIAPFHDRLQARHLETDTVAHREAQLGRVFTDVNHFLNLVSFIALLLGGIGVASAIHAHLKTKLRTVAVLRCLGASQAGRVALDGAVLLDTSARVDVPPERRRCGVVFQEARLLPHLSVETNLRYGARRAARRGMRAGGPGFEEVVDLLGIAPLLGRRPRALSGGERQRVALGRALLSRPLMLLMDEPLASLDAPRKAEILPLLERLRDGALPILYVTHALDEVDRLADTLVLLAAGRVQAAGPVEALSARTDLPALAGRRDAGSVLACVVAGHDPVRGLTALEFPGGTLSVPLRPGPLGARLRLRLRARDLALASEAPRGLSTHNVLACRVSAIDPAGDHEVFVSVRVGPTTMLARITRDAVSRLGLTPGRDAFALVKSTAFDHG